MLEEEGGDHDDVDPGALQGVDVEEDELVGRIALDPECLDIMMPEEGRRGAP